MRPLYLLTALPVARAVERSPLDWPNVLQQPWLFDQGSTYGFRLEAGGVRGPAPDWALASSIPLVDYGVLSEDAAGVAASFSYPGSLRFENNFTVGGSPLQVIAHLVFKSANMSVIRVMVKNHGPQPVVTRFRAALSNINVTQSPENAVVFSLPAPQVPCFSGQDFSRGSLFFSSTFLSSGSQQNLTWRHANQSADSLVVLSSNVSIETLGVASAFISIAFAGNAASPGASASELQEVFDNSIKRWKSYLGLLMAPEVLDRNMQWVAVKALMTLMNNWRSVPGLPDGVLPSYRGYESGFWSWDSYKQAVGMVHFAPQLAKDQLRLIVSARNTETGHIPDKVDRCGAAGGCNGKPPLLAWAAWQVFQATHDFSFLQEMYNISKQFHDYWYLARDVKGAGLCSWTQGMESGMDNGVRFLPEYAQMVTNVSSHAALLAIEHCELSDVRSATSVSKIKVTTFNFWSIDLNAYLYKDKLSLGSTCKPWRGETSRNTCPWCLGHIYPHWQARQPGILCGMCDPRTFANMANALGMDKEAKEWTAAAGRLLPKLRQTFFVPDERPPWIY